MKNMLNFKNFSADELMEIVSDNDTKAGTYEFIDKTAIQIIKRSAIKTVIVNGNNPENVITAITEPIGTLITSEWLEDLFYGLWNNDEWKYSNKNEIKENI